MVSDSVPAACRITGCLDVNACSTISAAFSKPCAASIWHRILRADSRYFGFSRTAGGGYAEYALVRETMAAPAPAGISLSEAASVPLAALTALQSLRDKARVSDGSEVLVYGASGGVGTFAVQVAKSLGGRVTAAASGRSAEFLRGLGADQVVDYTKGIDHLCARFDVVLDAVDKLPFRRTRRLLRPRGVVVTTNPVAEWLVNKAVHGRPPQFGNPIPERMCHRFGPPELGQEREKSLTQSENDPTTVVNV